MSKNNSYTIESSDINFSGGRYISSNPYNAAKKAASQLFRKAHNEEKFKKYKSLKNIKFILRETTSGSSKKEFTYKAVQTKLTKPIIVNIKGTEIIYKYKINITSLNINNVVKKSKKGGNNDMDKELNNNFAMSGGCGEVTGGTCSIPQ